MLSALDSGASDTGSSPGRGHCVVLLGRTLTVPLSTQQYKWVPANRPFPTLSTRGLVHNHSYKNEFNLHVNGISFSYERVGTKTRFEKEAKGNSEMAYCGEVTCDGLASRPGGVEILLAASCVHKTGIISGSYEPLMAPRLH